MTDSNRRLAVSGAVGAVIAGGVAFVLPWQVAVLLGWCLASLTFLGPGRSRARCGLNAAETEALATTEDPSHLVADGTLIVAAGASLIGVGFVLAKAGESSGVEKGLTAGLGAVSVALAWTTLQTIFMLRYARLYYRERRGRHRLRLRRGPRLPRLRVHGLHRRDDLPSVGHHDSFARDPSHGAAPRDRCRSCSRPRSSRC